MSLASARIVQALCDRLAGIEGLVSPPSRTLRTWDDVTADQQPALFVSLGSMEPRYGSLAGTPPVWVLHITVYLYARHDADENEAPGDPLLLMVQRVEAALERQAGETAPKSPGPHAGTTGFSQTTLGDLVLYARISGAIETDEGALGEQGVAVIPVEVMAVSTQ